MNIIEGRRIEGWCGVASLQYALGMLGLALDQNVISLLAKTTQTEGTSGENMKRVPELFGYKADWLQGASLDSLDALRQAGASVILNHMSGANYKEDGHYVVLQEVTEETITVQDPEWIGSIKTYKRDLFESVWFDFDPDTNEKLEKWALVISK